MFAPPARMTRPALAIAMLSTLILSPVASAVGNEAHVEADENGAVAVCQLAVLVRAVIVLDLEDSLGLVARQADEPLSAALASAVPADAPRASCDVTIGTLRIVVPAGESARAGSYVSGPPAAAFAREPATSVAGDNVAICQHFLLIDSVIITGGAYGLPTGASAKPLLVSPGDGRASCRTGVGELEIVELPAAREEPSGTSRTT